MNVERRNVLLLSAGRRVSLARMLRSSAERCGAELICADMFPALSAACQDNAKSVPISGVNSPEYRERLIEICSKYKIGLVIPTIDTELAMLSQMRPDFKLLGTEIVVSDLGLVSLSRDKRLTADYFTQFSLTSPEVYDPNAIFYPAIAKPFDGSLSCNVTILSSVADLSDRIRSTKNIMFAAYIDHTEHEEFTVDAYYDRNSALKCVVPRLRLEVRGGEVSKGQTVKNELVDLFFSTVASLPGARGCLTFQVFRHRTTEAIWLIELNPRFGGGYPLTSAAGAPYHDWLVREYVLNEQIPIFMGWQDRKTMLRYDEAVFLDA